MVKYYAPRVERKPCEDGGQVIQQGWVGLHEGNYIFKPSRGSGGFALYDSEANCLRYSGCTKAIKVEMILYED